MNAIPKYFAAGLLAAAFAAPVFAQTNPTGGNTQQSATGTRVTGNPNCPPANSTQGNTQQSATGTTVTGGSSTSGATSSITPAAARTMVRIETTPVAVNASRRPNAQPPALTGPKTDSGSHGSRGEKKLTRSGRATCGRSHRLRDATHSGPQASGPK